MKTKNIFTGERLMTESNALRHYIKKGKKLLSSGNLKGFSQMLKEHDCSMVLDTAPACEFCEYEDIGYCGLRNGKAEELGYTDDSQLLELCYPCIIAGWEDNLEHNYPPKKHKKTNK